jgi:hypothetical protein
VKPLLTLGLLCLLLPAHGGAAESFTIVNAELLRQDKTYVLRADVDYHFTSPVLKALRNGVPLNLVAELRVLRPRRWWPDAMLTAERLRFQLRYHALAKLYQVEAADSGMQQNFVSLPAALAALGHIRQPLDLKRSQVFLGQTYPVRLRVFLDLEELPLPLRTVAYFTPRWHLTSAWHSWTYAE